MRWIVGLRGRWAHVIRSLLTHTHATNIWINGIRSNLVQRNYIYTYIRSISCVIVYNIAYLEWILFINNIHVSSIYAERADWMKNNNINTTEETTDE